MPKKNEYSKEKLEAALKTLEIEIYRLKQNLKELLLILKEEWNG